MIAYKISFFEEDDLPDNPEPFMIYLVMQNGVANSYVTDRTGAVKPMGNVPLIQQVAGDLAIVSGGSGLTTVIHNEDTNIVALKNTAIYIPSGTFITTARTINISSLNTDGDRLEIYNHDSSGRLFFADATQLYVYEALWDTRLPIATGSIKIIRINNKNLT